MILAQATGRDSAEFRNQGFLGNNPLSCQIAVREQQRSRIIAISAYTQSEPPHRARGRTQKLRALSLAGRRDQHQRAGPPISAMDRLSGGNHRLTPLPRAVQNPAPRVEEQHFALLRVGRKLDGAREFDRVGNGARDQRAPRPALPKKHVHTTEVPQDEVGKATTKPGIPG